MWTLESDYYLKGSKDFVSEAMALKDAEVCFILGVPTTRLLKDGQEVMDRDGLHRRVLRDNPKLAKS
ncbi:hypothetical protein AB8B02_05780 [Tardiphaga sp. 862_B3_N4_1]|uniref:hypothetical protein n=1 Tax=Tardiphaga sp. 862_B3_N4_1 TaxID=3240764 RepID=UPI003F25C690